MTLKPMAESILNNEINCMAEINLYNAMQIKRWIANKKSHHEAKDCKRGKDCVHKPGKFTQEWAEFLIDEMPEICTCEKHKKDNT